MTNKDNFGTSAAGETAPPANIVELKEAMVNSYDALKSVKYDSDNPTEFLEAEKLSLSALGDYNTTVSKYFRETGDESFLTQEEQALADTTMYKNHGSKLKNMFTTLRNLDSNLCNTDKPDGYEDGVFDTYRAAHGLE